MKPTDQELLALARVSASPEWRHVKAMVEREKAKWQETLVAGIELHKIHRAQSAVSILTEFVSVAESADQILREKRGG